MTETTMEQSFEGSVSSEQEDDDFAYYPLSPIFLTLYYSTVSEA